MSPLPNTAQIISELEYELEGSINVCPWLGTTSAVPTILCFMSKKLFALGSLTNEFQPVHTGLSERLKPFILFSQIMGRRVRKESYRIYWSALKVRFLCQS